MANDKKMKRSANKMLAGVCGGLAEYFDADVTLIRVIYAALTIFCGGFPGVLLYIILLLIMPPASPNDRFEDAEVVDDKKKKKED